MIRFLLKQKWRFCILQTNIPSLTAQLFANLQILLVFVFTGLLYNYTMEHDVNIQPGAILLYLNGMALLLPTLHYFFPGVKAKENLFQKYHPIHWARKTFVMQTVSLFSKISTYTFLIIPVIFLGIIKEFQLPDYLQLSTSFICGILMAEWLLTMFHTEEKWLFAVCIAISGLIAGYNIHVHFTFNTLSITVLLLLDLAAGVYYHTKIGTYNIGYRKQAPGNPVFYTLIYNKKSLTAVITGIMLQGMMAWAVLAFIIDDVPFAIYFCLLPISIFFYCYNNTWGFFRPQAFVYLLAGRSIADFFLLYLKLLLPALLISQLINCIIIYLTGHTLNYTLLWGIIVTNSFAIVNGIFFSFLSMRKADKTPRLHTGINNSAAAPLYIVSGIAMLLGFAAPYKPVFFLLVASVFLLTIIQAYLLYRYSYYFMNKLKLSLVAF